MIQAFIGPLTNLAGTWLNNRAQKAQIKQRIQVAKLEAKVKKIETDGDWELEQAKASQDSWKDELWTIVFVAILIANFIPLWGIQEYMAKGFENLEKCPEWVTYGMYASIAASFGLRSFTKLRRK